MGTYSSQFLAILAMALVSLVISARAGGITNDSSIASGQTFDYIVVGAGLTGTTVAARLAEDPALSILVVEVGADNRQDPEVFDIYEFTVAFGGPLDWAWETDGGRTIIHGCVHFGHVGEDFREADADEPDGCNCFCSGKTLGGSSSINGAVWTRGAAAQYDAWSDLLEKEETSVGWNWENLFAYMKKVWLVSVPVLSHDSCRLRRPRGSPHQMPSSRRRARVRIPLSTDLTGQYKQLFQTGSSVAQSSRHSWTRW